jgi:hypothetical protein
MVPDDDFQIHPPACRHFCRLRMEARPSFIEAEIRVFPRKHVSQQFAAFREGRDDEVQLLRREAECRPQVLVD